MSHVAHILFVLGRAGLNSSSPLVPFGPHSDLASTSAAPQMTLVRFTDDYHVVNSQFSDFVLFAMSAA